MSDAALKKQLKYLLREHEAIEIVGMAQFSVMASQCGYTGLALKANQIHKVYQDIEAEYSKKRPSLKTISDLESRSDRMMGDLEAAAKQKGIL